MLVIARDKNLTEWPLGELPSCPQHLAWIVRRQRNVDRPFSLLPLRRVRSDSRIYY
jgi:hypothetical protein